MTNTTDTVTYQPARLGPDPLHQHACGHVECWPDDHPEGPITSQGCDACESAPDGSWQPLYVRRPGMSDQTDTTPTGLLDLFDQIRQHIAELEQVAPPAGPGSAAGPAQDPERIACWRKARRR